GGGGGGRGDGPGRLRLWGRAADAASDRHHAAISADEPGRREQDLYHRLSILDGFDGQRRRDRLPHLRRRDAGGDERHDLVHGHGARPVIVAYLHGAGRRRGDERLRREQLRNGHDGSAGRRESHGSVSRG